MKEITTFIAKHLENKIIEDIIDVDGRCAFCGKEIKRGIHKYLSISSNFTDWGLFKFKSDYLCIDCALCFKGDIRGSNGKLRNFNVVITNKEIRNIKKDQVGEVLKTVKNNFILLITYSRKKHHFFYSAINSPNNDIVVVGTDKGQISFNKDKYYFYAEICKELLDAGFSRKDIKKGETKKLKEVEKIGLDKFFNYMKFIGEIRKTNFLNFLLYTI